MSSKKIVLCGIPLLLFFSSSAASINNDTLIPVAYWNFDDTTSQSFKDITSNGHNAHYTDAGMADGVAGKALECTKDSFDIIVDKSLSDFNMIKHFTVEAWIYSYISLVKPGSFYNYKAIFDNSRTGMEGSGVTGGFALLITDKGKLCASIGQQSKWISVESADTLYSNTWYHVAATYDGDSLKIFINGKLINKVADSSGFIPAITPCRIGCQYQILSETEGRTRDYFKGKIDELKLYDTALDQATIAASYNALKPGVKPDSSLIAHWTFNAIDGKGFTDVSENNHKAIFSNVTLNDGISGKAVECKDTAFDIMVENSVSDFNINRFTIEAWIYSYIDLVNPGSFYNYKAIFDNSRTGLEMSGIRGGYALQITDKGNLSSSVAKPGTWVTTQSSDILQPNTWYHVATTYDGTYLRLYLNGQLCNQVETNGELISTNIPARIGCQFQVTSATGTEGRLRDWFNGKIDELKLYNYALSPEKINDDFLAVKPETESPFEINFGMKASIGKPGDTVMMPVYITNFEDFSISACQMTATFDPSVLTLLSISNDSGITSTWLQNYNVVQPGNIQLATAGTATPIGYGDGEVFRFIFKVNNTSVAGKSSKIHLSNIVIDEKYSLVHATSTDGEITVLNTSPILYGDVTGNDEVNIIDAQKVLSYVVGGLQLPDITCPNFTTAIADVSGNGTITSYDAALILQHSIGLLPEFPVVTKNHSLSKQQAVLTEPSPALFSIDFENTGSDLIYKISGRNLKGFTAGEFSIAFIDTNAAISRGIIRTNLPSASLTSKYDTEHKTLKVALIVKDDIDDNNQTTLFKIELPPSNNLQSNTFSINTVLINEGKIPYGGNEVPLTSLRVLPGKNHVYNPILKNRYLTFAVNGQTSVLQIWSLAGKLLETKSCSGVQNLSIDLHNTPSGIYIFKISGGSGMNAGKFIIR